MGLFNISTSIPSISKTIESTYKHCKRCSLTLPLSDFYSDAFYCKRCHKIINALSKNKSTISAATMFWSSKRSDDLYRGELALFRPNSTYYSWMMPLFFASIHEKQWHIYLYAFYMTEPIDLKTNTHFSSNKERAEKALCKETTLTPEETFNLKQKLLREEHIIDNSHVYDLSIPYITQFYKKAGPRLKRQIAIFTRTKICSSCKEEKYTHEAAHNPTSTYNLLTNSPKSVRVKPFHFKRSYSTRDRWNNICRRCEDLSIPADHPDGLTARILAQHTLDDKNYDPLVQIELERKQYNEYKKNPFKEINEQRHKDKLERISDEDDPFYIHEFNTINEYIENKSNTPPTPSTPDGGLGPDSDSPIHIDEEIFPDS